MKRSIFCALAIAALSGCASTPPDQAPDQAARDREIYGDAATPGRGVHLGIGAGSWGGRSGGGVGIGLGF